MICPDCQTEIVVRPDADVKICTNCRRSKRRRRHVPELEPKNEAKIRYRIDSRHNSSEVDFGKDQRKQISFVSSWLGTGSQSHSIFFGLLVFLLGQVLHVWAFLVGNYLAWTIANFMTVVGVTIFVFAIVKTIKNFENRISMLAKLKSPHQPTRNKRARAMSAVEEN